MKFQKNKTLSLYFIFGAIVCSAVLFQNCGGKDDGVVIPSLNPAPGSTPTAVGTAIADKIQLLDGSLSDGTVITYVNQKVYGGKAGLRACTGLLAVKDTACLNESDFRAFGTYDASNDVYTMTGDVRANGWPHGTYFTRYLASDGSRVTLMFTPIIAFKPAEGTIASRIVLHDLSYGNGEFILQVTQQVIGGQAGLRACSGFDSNVNTSCLKDSDFISFGTYNKATDTYSMDADVSAYKWPQTRYFTRFLASDGSKVTITWTPKTGVTTN